MANWVPVHKFAIACGTGGAYVDVSTLVMTDTHVTRSWGKQSAFDDAVPGTFTVPLDNRDGRFTPDALALAQAAGYGTALTDGMGVSWEVDGTSATDLRWGTITGFQIVFADPDLAASARIILTITDSLGVASRTNLLGLAYSAVMGCSPYFFYQFNEAAGSTQALDATGNLAPLTPMTNGTGVLPTFGITAPAWISTTQAQVTGGPTTETFLVVPNGPAMALPSKSLGFLNVLVTPLASAAPNACQFSTGYLDVGTDQDGFTASVSWPGFSGVTLTWVGHNPSLAPMFVSLGATWTLAGSTYTVTANLYVNGVLATTGTGTTTVAPPTVTLTTNPAEVVDSPGTGSDATYVAHFSYTQTQPLESFAAGGATEAQRLAVIDNTSAQIQLGTLPAALSPQPLGLADTSGQSILNALTDVMRTEQGQIYAATSGTLLAPVQVINVRERTRPSTVSAQFALNSDILDSIQFVRDLSNTFSQINATGVDGSGNAVSATWTDPTLTTKVGSANASFVTLYEQQMDVFDAATDRTNRAKFTGIPIISFTIDATGTNGVDRSTDILSLALGNNYQVTGLPAAQLGYSTWNFFLIGVSEDHVAGTSLFTLYCEAIPQTPAVYNASTSRYSAGGVLSIGAVNATTTSFTVSSTNPLVLLSTTECPYTMLVDAEQVTVTAVTGSSSPQTATVTRGANSTTAAAHSAGANIEIAQPAYYGY